MSSYPVAIMASGMVTGVGLDASSSCAAIRATIDNFQETRFMDGGGEWIQGCEVPLEQPWRGTKKLAKMLAMALTECAQEGGVDLASVPVLVCIAEQERPGRVENLGNKVFFETQQELGIRFHEKTGLIQHGRVGAMVALLQARKLLYQDDAIQAVMIAGVDSLLNGPAITAYEQQHRILTSQNSNGFIPGEAASAVLVTKPEPSDEPRLICMGLGFGQEQATIDSEEPLRAEGLVTAIKASLADAGAKMEELDYRIVDVSGEHYWFKESSLALLRTLHVPQEEFDIWHPSDCIGEVGAAIGPVVLTVARKACEDGYSKGHNILSHFSNIDSRRAAGILSYRPVRVA